jgi:ubiquinone/menaquinone biosynthesis C-methylase UbiE
MSDARATAKEFLDQPDCDPSLAAASYRFMEAVNGTFGGTRVARLFLSAETKGCNINTPLRILDIGSGSCDIPLALSRWARERAIPIEISCLEVADQAVAIARRKLALANDPAVHLLQEDAFTHQPSEPYDCAVSSMCFHHFDNDQILVLLQRLRRFVTHRVLINVLRAARHGLHLAPACCWPLPARCRASGMMRCSPFVAASKSANWRPF